LKAKNEAASQEGNRGFIIVFIRHTNDTSPEPDGSSPQAPTIFP